MSIQTLFVINRAGGLTFQRAFSEDAPPLTQNDYLHLASTFHGMQLMAKELSPVRSGNNHGIEILETNSFILTSYYAPSGVEFFVTAALRTEKVADFLHSVYALYADYVMKNPFYELDMPIKCELWDTHLKALVDRTNRTTS